VEENLVGADLDLLAVAVLMGLVGIGRHSRDAEGVVTVGHTYADTADRRLSVTRFCGRVLSGLVQELQRVSPICRGQRRGLGRRSVATPSRPQMTVAFVFWLSVETRE
jgi:hypothetical protein